VGGVFLIPAAILLELDALAVVDLRLGRYVVATLALLALQRHLGSLVGSHDVSNCLSCKCRIAGKV
jgi:hypothetical protein